MIAILGLATLAAMSTPKDFAYRMRVTAPSDAAAYRAALPLDVYQKIVHPDLADLRVFNSNGEQVPFAIEKPTAGTVVGADKPLPIFPLKDDSDATLDAIRVTIESGRSAVNFQSAGQTLASDRVARYLIDGRALDTPVSSLILAWPNDAADFAGRVKVEASDSLSDWRVVAGAAPIANLHSTADRLVEQRIEFSATKAKFWRLSWVGQAAPFVLTSIGGGPAERSVEVLHASLTVAAKPTKGGPSQSEASQSGASHSGASQSVPSQSEPPNAGSSVEAQPLSKAGSSKATPGEFEYDTGATVPIDRLNLELPDINSVVYVELLSRARPQDAWNSVGRRGFYRLKSAGEELRNGPVPVNLTTDRYWLVRTDPRQGGLGSAAPKLSVEWVPHQVVFVARGAGPFQVAYGSFAAESAAVSLSMLPKNLTIAPASLSDPEASGDQSLLQAPADPFPWKTPLLWVMLIAGAGFLGWMALKLSKDVSRQ